MLRSLIRWRAFVAAGLALPLIALSVPAVADTMPTDPNDPKTPVTVAADALPTVQINGVVWQQTVIGNTVYAVGSFDKARPAGSAAGTNEVTRKNLLAYDLNTGQLRTGFVADLNAQAKSVTASPDGTTLYVGGDFTSVTAANGTSKTVSRIVALNPTTGAVLSGFPVTANNQVKSIVVAPSTGTVYTVYLGGSFSTINGIASNKIGAVTSTGGFLPAFKPVIVDGAVLAMALAPDKSKLVVAGSFTKLNGSSNPGYGIGAVDPTTGANVLPFKVNNVVNNAGANSAIYSLSADTNNFYGTGYVFGSGGVLEGAFSANWSDGSIKWLEDCHGDTYAAYPSTNAVYVAGHSHYCGNLTGGFPETNPRTYHHAITFSKAATGTVKTNAIGSYHNFGGQPAPQIQNWIPDINTGTYTGQGQGPWTVTGSGSYVLYGGEFTQVNSTKQQGLVRFATSNIAPNLQGPRATGTDFTLTASSPAPGTVNLAWPANWDRDNSNLAYTLYQDNVVINTRTVSSVYWNRPSLTYTQLTVPAGNHTYKVNVKDPFGNSVTSASVTVTVIGPARKALAATPDESAEQQTATPDPAPSKTATPDPAPSKTATPAQ